eukprot:SAG11_NODE_2542_length_3237_cov_1.924841_2_plen_181_part_00
MHALGFAEVEGELRLQLSWGRPDVVLLERGYTAMAATATRLGVTVPPISFEAVPASDTSSTAVVADPSAATTAASPPEVLAGQHVKNFNVRDGARSFTRKMGRASWCQHHAVLQGASTRLVGTTASRRGRSVDRSLPSSRSPSLANKLRHPPRASSQSSLMILSSYPVRQQLCFALKLVY